MAGQVVEELWTYPITGGPGVQVEHAKILPSGIVGDRAFIVAEAVEGKAEDRLRRVGSLQAPELSQLRYASNSLAEVAVGSTTITLPELDRFDESPPDAICDEFGDHTPVRFAGSDYDEVFSGFLGRDVRLVYKTAAWVAGKVIPPEYRANAPLHIVSTATIAWLRAQNGSNAIDSRRLRPEIVLSGLEANEELRMLGQWISCVPFNVPILLNRATPRCRVPGRDPETGEDLGDVSLRNMEKGTNRKGQHVASAGVYGYSAEFGGTLVSGRAFEVITSS